MLSFQKHKRKKNNKNIYKNHSQVFKYNKQTKPPTNFKIAYNQATEI